MNFSEHWQPQAEDTVYTAEEPVIWAEEPATWAPAPVVTFDQLYITIVYLFLIWIINKYFAFMAYSI